MHPYFGKISIMKQKYPPRIVFMKSCLVSSNPNDANSVKVLGKAFQLRDQNLVNFIGNTNFLNIFNFIKGQHELNLNTTGVTSKAVYCVYFEKVTGDFGQIIDEHIECQKAFSERELW